jgi:Fe-S cluster assembly scaffold protein SufB
MSELMKFQYLETVPSRKGGVFLPVVEGVSPPRDLQQYFVLNKKARRRRRRRRAVRRVFISFLN